MRVHSKGKFALAIAGWATASCALALCVLIPSSLNAVGAAGGVLRSEIDDPKLVVEGVELRVAQANPADAILVGKFVALTLTAKNTSDKSITISPAVIVVTTPPIERMSRVAPIQQEIWRTTPTITLSANETKTIAINDAPAVKADSRNSVTIQNGNEQVVALRFNLPKS